MYVTLQLIVRWKHLFPLTTFGQINKNGNNVCIFYTKITLVWYLHVFLSKKLEKASLSQLSK